jgi:hypothetical protein
MSKRKLSSILLGMVSTVLLTSPAIADQRLRICIGEYEKLCRAETHADAWYPCGTQVEDAGRQVCTVYTSTGSVIKPFRILRVSDEGGNKCGYAVFDITCLDQSQQAPTTNPGLLPVPPIQPVPGQQ